MYEVPNRTASKQNALNWTMWSQTKGSTAKSSCDICVLLRYYAVTVVIPYRRFGKT